MSRFYGSLSGSAGTATRQGSARSGLVGHVRGWDVGVIVDANDDMDEDVFFIYASGGSNDTEKRKYLGLVRLVDGEPTFVPV